MSSFSLGVKNPAEECLGSEWKSEECPSGFEDPITRECAVENANIYKLDAPPKGGRGWCYDATVLPTKGGSGIGQWLASRTTNPATNMEMGPESIKFVRRTEGMPWLRDMRKAIRDKDAGSDVVMKIVRRIITNRDNDTELDVMMHLLDDAIVAGLMPPDAVMRAAIEEDETQSWTLLYGVMQRFLDAGVDPNYTDSDGRMILHLGLTANMYKLFIAHGADVNAVDNDGWTPFHYACENDEGPTILLLAEHGADVNAADLHGVTGVMIAAERYNLAMLRLLATLGADFSKKDRTGEDAYSRVHSKYLMRMQRPGYTFRQVLSEAVWPSDETLATEYATITRFITNQIDRPTRPYQWLRNGFGSQ